MMKNFLSQFSPTPKLDVPPIWLMRQAGRYLPEYQALRKEAGGFLNLCYRPDRAEEVTLQPIRRYGFDAAILFADILLVPHALGQELWFETGEGPRLTPVRSGDAYQWDQFHTVLAPVYETVSRLTVSLPKETTLIGFAGAPWTVASYAIAGRGTSDQAPAKQLMAEDPAAFQSILDVLIEATTQYLARQVASGAEVLQIFESWAGSLSGEAFETACIVPVQKIISNLRSMGISVPIIVFPRASTYDIVTYVQETGADGVSLDQFCDFQDVIDRLPAHIVSQGNLDPELLITGGADLIRAINDIRDLTQGRPHIFNLGHGITPQTPPENVALLVNHIRQDVR